MKTLTIIFLSCLFLALCSNSYNSSVKGDCAMLQQQVDSLTAILQHRISVTVDPDHSKRLSSIAQGEEFARNFYGMKQSGELLIPAAWNFKSYVFDSLLMVNGVESIRFYTAIQTGEKTLTLLAVPVDKDGNDLLGSDEIPNIFDFTTMCPQECGINQLNPQPKMYRFQKSEK